MDNKTIKITKEEAISYYNSSQDKGFKDLLEKTFGVDLFKPRDITEIVYDLDSLDEYCRVKKIEFCLIFPIDTKCKTERMLNAVYILNKVAEVYNQTTKLDWNNITIYKYLPYKYFSSGGGSGVVGSSVWRYDLDAPAGLYYKSSKLSKASYKNFKQYWEDYWAQ